ncbi:hypothetical protein ACFQU7_22390 [Pseudoroseomonas wenyumeiae]
MGAWGAWAASRCCARAVSEERRQAADRRHLAIARTAAFEAAIHHLQVNAAGLDIGQADHQRGAARLAILQGHRRHPGDEGVIGRAGRVDLAADGVAAGHLLRIDLDGAQAHVADDAQPGAHLLLGGPARFGRGGLR